MPPVRWKFLQITTTVLFLAPLFIANTKAQGMQEAISMTSDGWRPIVGTRKDTAPFNAEILHYRNQNGESIKAETPSTTTTPSTSPPGIKHTQGALLKPGNKIPLHSKPIHHSPPHINRAPNNKNHHGHGPHIPLSHLRGPQIKKPYLQVVNMGGKRHHVKPMRVQVSNHGNRDEVFVGAHSSNSYSFYKPIINHQNNVKTRETIGLGNPYLNQPHHIDFSNRFALPPSSESVFSQFNSPIQSFIFPKHPQSNDINYQFQNQNDDYTRNLVPPPLLYKENVKNNNKENGATTEQILVPKHNNNNQRLPSEVQLPLPPQFAFPSKHHQTNADVQVTKEKLNVFHNNIPASYSGDYVDYDFHSLKKFPTTSDPQKPQTYEVTEIAKPWSGNTPPHLLQRPRKPVIKEPVVELNVPQFLPTPYRPEGQGIVPTLPSQAEVSTIFTKLSQIQRDKFLSTSTPDFFDVKEVSTHYPILGKPSFVPSPQDTAIDEEEPEEVTNEITTTEDITTKEPQRPQRPYRRRRPTGSRLRTSTTSTTTEEPPAITDNESYESQKTTKEDEEDTERPLITRQRVRPTRYRTTPPPEEPVKVTRGRYRYRTRLENDLSLDQPIRKRIRPEIFTEPPATTTSESTNPETEAIPTTESEELDDFKKTGTLVDNVERPSVNLEIEDRPTLTSERTITTNLHLPENEIEDEIVTTVTVPTTTTMTTTPTTTSKPHRIRGRPIKYDNSNRPRFSVKDYRQKLNQYTSNPTTTTESSYRTSPEANSKFRFPSRGRRPFSSTTQRNDEDGSDTEVIKSRFVPKEPRHGGTTEAIITDKNVKAVNTRLRPFGRYRSTTPSPSSSTPKVSIKPNLFTRRRPPSISLKMRIQNRMKKNETDAITTTTEESQTEESETDSEEAETTNHEESMKLRTTTEDFNDDVDDNESGVETTTLSDILKNDQVDYSQRVSDLTSSDKNDYNAFKSVSPTSRRIPNYFTIATDDPILPIEAFFTNFKENNKN